jgi:hypothetical protein
MKVESKFDVGDKVWVVRWNNRDGIFYTATDGPTEVLVVETKTENTGKYVMTDVYYRIQLHAGLIAEVFIHASIAEAQATCDIMNAEDDS